MENHRTLLYLTLFFLVYLLWSQWQLDYGPKLAVTDTPVADQSVPALNATDDVPPPTTTMSSDSSLPVSPDTKGNKMTSSLVDASSQIVTVVTDLLELQIDSKGGNIVKATLRNYAVNAEEPETKLSLLNNESSLFYVAQSGLVSVDQVNAPTHNSIYQVTNTEYRLAEGENSISVPMTWNSPNGTVVTKTYTFKRSDYVIDVVYDIKASESWSGSQYMQLVRARPLSESESTFIRTYTGGVIYDEEIKYEKIDFDDIAESNLNRQLKDGWLAMIQHYFLSAWIPEQGKNLYYSKYLQSADQYLLGVRTGSKKASAGEEIKFSSRLVIGPKLQNKLETIEKGLELTVDYGVLTIIAKPLFWLLNIFHNWFANWGWAIIFLTITVKAVFYKLSEMSYRSMARMRKVAPRMQQMKERFGDDKQAMSKAMMDLYRREKINPMGGCLPIVVQIPVFISLYWVLLESVEMRHAPFILWITNLSDKDPFFVLPVLMGISMYIQYKLNPAPIDPVQQKIFQYMPFAFTAMFAFFPSGLVLYWVVNNVLSIAQQWVITRRIENE